MNNEESRYFVYNFMNGLIKNNSVKKSETSIVISCSV
jgi:hypothetical protein